MPTTCQCDACLPHACREAADLIIARLHSEGVEAPSRLPAREKMGEWLGVGYARGRELRALAQEDPRFVTVTARGPAPGVWWTDGDYTTAELVAWVRRRRARRQR